MARSSHLSLSIQDVSQSKFAEAQSVYTSVCVLVQGSPRSIAGDPRAESAAWFAQEYAGPANASAGSVAKQLARSWETLQVARDGVMDTLAKDAAERKVAFAPRIVSTIEEFIQRLNIGSCRHGSDASVRYFLPKDLGAINFLAKHDRFQESMRDILTADADTAAAGIEILLPLALSAYPVVAHRDLAFAVAPSADSESAITLAFASATLQIAVAKVLVAWLGKEMGTEIATLEWVKAMIEALNARDVCVRITDLVEGPRQSFQQLSESAKGGEEQDGIAKSVAGLLLPFVANFLAHLDRASHILEEMKTAVLAKVKVALESGIQELESLYPTDWADFAADPATRDADRVKRTVLKNPRHKDIAPCVDKLGKIATSAKVFGSCWVRRCFSTKTHAFKSSSAFLGPFFRNF